MILKKTLLYTAMLGVMFLELMALGQTQQLTLANATSQCGMTLLGAFVISRWLERQAVRPRVTRKGPAHTASEHRPAQPST